MRRLLRNIAENQTDQIGDTTTLADPHVVEVLVQGEAVKPGARVLLFLATRLQVPVKS